MLRTPAAGFGRGRVGAVPDLRQVRRAGLKTVKGNLIQIDAAP